MEQGVVRKIRCSYSPLTITQLERLTNIIQREPCVLQELDIGWCTRKPDVDGTGQGSPADAFDGWPLDKILVPPTQTIACRRIININLSALGLVGPISAALGQCTLLRSL